MDILFDAVNDIGVIDGNTAHEIYVVVDDILSIPHRIDGNGKYWVCKPDGTDNIHLPLTLFTSDRMTENTALDKDVKDAKGLKDDVDDPKYFMVDDNGTWELYDKDDWVVKGDEIIY